MRYKRDKPFFRISLTGNRGTDHYTVFDAIDDVALNRFDDGTISLMRRTACHPLCSVGEYEVFVPELDIPDGCLPEVSAREETIVAGEMKACFPTTCPV